MMDNGLIVREYRASKNKAENVKIQAELNGTTVEEIRKILIEGGVRPEELPRAPRKKPTTPEEKAQESAEEELSRAIQALRGIADRMRKEREVLEAREKKMDAAVSGLLAALRGGKRWLRRSGSTILSRGSRGRWGPRGGATWCCSSRAT